MMFPVLLSAEDTIESPGAIAECRAGYRIARCCSLVTRTSSGDTRGRSSSGS